MHACLHCLMQKKQQTVWENLTVYVNRNSKGTTFFKHYMYIPSLDDHVKYCQHPWKVHCLKTKRMHLQNPCVHNLSSFQLLTNITHRTVWRKWVNWRAHVIFWCHWRIWQTQHTKLREIEHLLWWRPSICNVSFTNLLWELIYLYQLQVDNPKKKLENHLQFKNSFKVVLWWKSHLSSLSHFKT